MGWLDRLRGASPPGAGPDVGEEADEPPKESHGSPGVAALFEGLGEGRDHVVLDLGPAAPSHVRLFSAFARQIRFAGLLPAPPSGDAFDEALRDIPPHPPAPYDLILLWDAFDRLAPADREKLVDRLLEITTEGAKLYAAVDASGDATTRPTRFVLESLERVTREPTGPPEPARPQLLSAEVQRLLEPFEVTRAFTLRAGLREYVAVRRAPP